MSGAAIFTGSVTGKTQANGAQTISLGADDCFREHQVQLEVSAQPAAGSLDVAVKTPGSNLFATVATIDMTTATATLAIVTQFTRYASQIRLTPTGFDADKTYSVYVASGAAA